MQPQASTPELSEDTKVMLVSLLKSGNAKTAAHAKQILEGDALETALAASGTHGHFLKAVMSGNWADAMGLADGYNLVALAGLL